MHRTLTALTLTLVAVACSDGVGPRPTAIQPPLAQDVAAPTGLRILRQSPTAPQLQAYRVSFWARRGTQTTVFVNYRRAAGEWLPDPFLRFRIPINGLAAGAGGAPLDRGDSVLITLTIDTVLFKVDFQPSGVVFSKSRPAQLAIWYQDADPDLNGDGVLDATDAMLQEQLAIWSQGTHTDGWKQLSSKNFTMQQYVATELYHFSQYAVAW
ncbi:MAG TPA: hypothetical protein VGQ06_02150 [Gemmatimonadales bacterium]|jgi:hypothetical protein|nr:hypothetical protein [Gemmatimonadales bacterium]